MSFQEIVIGCDYVVSLGGKNKVTGKNNPTSAEGHYINTVEVPNKFDKNKANYLHRFATENGIMGVYGKTDMDKKLKAATPGLCTRIELTGTKDTGKGNPMKCFKVMQDPTNAIDVSMFGAEAMGTGDDTADTDSDGFDRLDDTDVDADDTAADEALPARALPPRQAARAPSTATQDRVKQLLNKR